ncbi:hypothetical protein IJ531_00960 [bacterium]|nr:hypothetical protein [bacterium]
MLQAEPWNRERIFMPQEMIEFVKIAGCGGLLFLVFYLYHKTSSAQMMKIIDNNFKILEQLIAQGTLQTSYLQEIKTAIFNNLWCPYVRELHKKGVNNDK